MSAGKISWMIDENDFMTIIKVDGLAFPTPINGEDAAKGAHEAHAEIQDRNADVTGAVLQQRGLQFHHVEHCAIVKVDSIERRSKARHQCLMRIKYNRARIVERNTSGRTL